MFDCATELYYNLPMTKLIRKMTKTNIVAFAVLIVLTIAASIFVCVQAGYDAEESTKVSEWFTNITMKIFNENSLGNIKIGGKPMDIDMFRGFIRKFVGHFGIFAFIGLMLNLSLIQFMDRRPALLISVVYCFILASFTEFIQSNTPGRYGAFSDIILDTQGSLLAIFGLSTIFAVLDFLEYKMEFFNFIAISFVSFLFELFYFIFNEGNVNQAICNFLFALLAGYMFCQQLTFTIYTFIKRKKQDN